MLVQHLHAVVGLAVLAVRLSANGITHPGTCHQITLVTTVDKFASLDAQGLAVALRGILQYYLPQAVALFLDLYHTSLHLHRQVILAQHLLKGGQRNLGLEVEHSVGLAIDSAHPAVEVHGKSLNDLHSAHVCLAQSAGCEPAYPSRGLYQDYALAHPLGGERCCDATRCGAIHADVGLHPSAPIPGAHTVGISLCQCMSECEQCGQQASDSLVHKAVSY